MRLMFAVAVSFLGLAPAYAAHFEATGGAYGASVAITEDGCTASVLFDDASVSDVRGFYEVELPLIVVGRAAVGVEARGFHSGSTPAVSTLGAGYRQRTFFESDGEEGNWSRSFRLSGVRGPLALQMETSSTFFDASPSTLMIDSIDLSIENCSR